jgi:hypothetical protein
VFNYRPGGYGLSDIHKDLKEKGLGPHRIDELLCFALTFEPQARLSKQESKDWLDTVAENYSKFSGFVFERENLSMKHNL